MISIAALAIPATRAPNPMARYSSDPDDPGYAAYCEAKQQGIKVHCLLDGVEQAWVTVADEEAGILVKVVTDAKGFAVREGDEIKQDVLYGHVEVRLEYFPELSDAL